MSGTPDYNFAVDKPITELMKNNEEVLSIHGGNGGLCTGK
jgi:hypothetical protein